MNNQTNINKCRFCKTDDIYIQMHSGKWKIRCNEQYCLVVQCCDTENEAIERWNEINTIGE